jgi:hypothetical protein
MSSADTITEPESPPDWSVIAHDVVCPLCEYNLRGLSDARCPECGHPFVWAEVLDPARVHPWLFEHRDRRRIGAFVHTFAVSMLPRQFWRSVSATHQPNRRRLLGYWFGCAAVMLVVLLLCSAAALNPSAGGGSFVGDLVWYLSTLLSGLGSSPRAALILIGAFLAWPWMTLLTHAVFRETMRKARIRPEHVERCLVYSASVTVVFAMIFLILVVVAPPMVAARLWDLSPPLVLTPIVSCELILTYRMITAWRMYLRFPDAITTCIACQVIVTLALFTFFMYLQYGF